MNFVSRTFLRSNRNRFQQLFISFNNPLFNYKHSSFSNFPSNYIQRSRFHSIRPKFNQQPNQHPQQQSQSMPHQQSQPTSTTTQPPPTTQPPSTQHHTPSTTTTSKPSQSTLHEPSQQPQQHTTTTSQSHKLSQQQEEKLLDPSELHYYDPKRVRTEYDNQPGLRPLVPSTTEHLGQNLQKMTTAPIFEVGDAEITKQSIPSGQSLTKNVSPLMKSLQQKQLSPEEQQAVHKKNFKKLGAFGLCMAGIMYYMNAFYKARIAPTTEYMDPIDIDYTTRKISNSNNSVSILAEEIITDQVVALRSAQDHFQYMNVITPLPPILQPQNAMKLPLFVAKNPTRLQTKYNLIRHENEMKQIYDMEPLNNKNIDLYLNDVEKMDRAFRLSHDHDYTMATQPKNINDLRNQIGYQLNIK